MVMSASSAAFLAENFAGIVSVLAGASGTARAPLTNAALAGAAAFGACELGSSAPILPDGVCCAFSCCDCCCGSAAGGCCWAAARPALATNASASALVRKSSFRMAVSFSSAPERGLSAHPVRCGQSLCRLGETLVNAAGGSNVPPAGHRAPTVKASLRPRGCYLDTTAGGYSRRRCSQDAFGCVVLLELGLRFVRRGEI